MNRVRQWRPPVEARDFDGKLLEPGDTVQLVDWGPMAIRREVVAVARVRRLSGFVTVHGMLGWHPGQRFRKVK
jgi:hypothetical protein